MVPWHYYPLPCICVPFFAIGRSAFAALSQQLLIIPSHDQVPHGTSPTLTSLDGKETRSDGSRVRNAIFGSIEPPLRQEWRLLPSTSREMLFSGLIGMSSPMEVSLDSDSRKDYSIASD
ncbi:hypothetical protein B296_00008377 [Ensete ventricosum]|uniref:Uncharacterized protein n=1 Tax=Ensete ventricosum TaxID=4639 RepID=A0A427AF62_ENSVE|nr:hypothetical protein B296_00008377 [Ensete ventricosum]